MQSHPIFKRHGRERTCSTGFAALPLGVLMVTGIARAESLSRSTVGEGTRWATTCYVRDSGRPGPTVMVVGGIHGNEPAGARAADQIRHWPIERGRLVVVPQANVLALEAEQRHTPGAEKSLRDMNRNFPQAGGPASAACERSQALWQRVERHQPDWLIDLHEGYDFHQINDDSVGSSIVVDPSDEAKEAARLMLDAVNEDINDADKRFMRLAPPVDGSLARGAAEHLGADAMILETTRKSQSLSLRVQQHHTMVHRLLVHLEMIRDDLSAEQIGESKDEQRSAVSP